MNPLLRRMACDSLANNLNRQIRTDAQSTKIRDLLWWSRSSDKSMLYIDIVSKSEISGRKTATSFIQTTSSRQCSLSKPRTPQMKRSMDRYEIYYIAGGTLSELQHSIWNTSITERTFAYWLWRKRSVEIGCWELRLVSHWRKDHRRLHSPCSESLRWGVLRKVFGCIASHIHLTVIQ